MKQIHFICRGGVFRSRIARAIAEKQQENGVASKFEFISSGIEASENDFGDTCQWTQYLLNEHGLVKQAQPSWMQTTQALIDESSQVIFMSEDVYLDASKVYKLSGGDIVWDVKDMKSEFDDTDQLGKLNAEIIYQRIVNLVGKQF